jgi:hypothetical protein
LRQALVTVLTDPEQATERLTPVQATERLTTILAIFNAALVQVAHDRGFLR